MFLLAITASEEGRYAWCKVLDSGRCGGHNLIRCGRDFYCCIGAADHQLPGHVDKQRDETDWAYQYGFQGLQHLNWQHPVVD
ncbi:hypothetical protein GMSM_44350 [Geomonas sp. Red276]